MKLVLQLIVFFLPVFISAQWIDFDLANIEHGEFKNNIKPFISAVSISSANHFEDPFNINKRLQLGIAYTHGINISGNAESTELFGGYSSIGAGLMISENLKLRGNFAILNSGDNIIQSFAYGAGINISNNEVDNWRISLLFSEVSGPTDIELKSMDSNINYRFRIKNIPTIIGLGTNSYKSRILIDNEELPKTIKGNTLYLSLCVQFTKENFTTTPIIKLGSEVLIVGLEFSGVVI